MLSIANLKIPNRLIMAPLCGITHQAFRRLVKQYGAGLVFTQMVSAKAITMEDKNSLNLLVFSEEERPIGFQLFGRDPDTLALAASIAQKFKPDLIDLNLGCPARKVVNSGGGAALLKDPSLCRDIFKKMRKALTIPLTIKMRAGWDKDHDSALEIAKIAQDCGVDAITLHARTRAQGYSGHADWSLIKEFKETLSIPVIGNGDVTNYIQANQMMEDTGCDAVMVGRSAFSNPWIFKSYAEQKDYFPSPGELKDMILHQYESFFDLFGKEVGIKQMRKHICAYTKGIKNGARFRKEILTVTDWKIIQEKIERFFNNQILH